ncbi:MAG: protein-L-isoaspartate O-methyltransferase [Patescibacteria group bacterium]|jgi:protein-L-isoaspartate(D-aspartate) O-methyltransferase|nr:protein-L-isoaspartate O-methyltransferase [Patescibacteria group bacterium]
MDKFEDIFRQVDRRLFVPKKLVDQTDLDMPLPIGFGQTISQPTTVKLMLGWLDPQSEDRVMDIGSGSGWTTALLAHLVGPNGTVFAIEKIPELVAFGKNNCQKIGVKNVRFFKATKEYGLPKFAPYNRILVSASAQNLPTTLLNQLAVGGKLVIPVKNSVLEITKTKDGDINIEEHPGFIFVPLV